MDIAKFTENLKAPFIMAYAEEKNGKRVLHTFINGHSKDIIEILQTLNRLFR